MLRLRSSHVLAVVSAILATCPAYSQGAESVAENQLAIASPTAGGTSSPDNSLPTIQFEKYRLKNGLEVILSEDHRLPLVATNIWYHVGPANERPGKTGFAHLFEHMMFEGSKHVGAKAHFKHLEAAGASSINGTTDFDRTNYFETLPSNQLELALWLESDRMGFLKDTLDREKLANQRDVVRNERRQSVENSPYGLVEEAVYHELFPKTHPYYASVMGSHADIEAARLADVREFHNQYYAPNNASLAIVGDFNKAQAKAFVEKYFGTLPSGPPVPKIDAQTPPITSERRVTVTDQVELPRVYMAWITPAIFKPGNAETNMIAHIIGGGKSSRLYKKLVYELQIAQDVSVENDSLLLGSVCTLQATAKPGVKIEDLEKAINAELSKFRQEGSTQAEVDGARNTIQSGIIRRLESLGGFGGVADRLNQYNHFLGDPGYLPHDLKRYSDATVSDLKQIYGQSFGDNQRVVVYGVPGKKVIEDVPQTAADTEKEGAPVVALVADEPWRTTPPKPGELSKLSLPTPTSFKLANGLTVYLIGSHNLPVVSATLVTLSGNDTNPVDKPGLAGFTADMLDEGTTNRSSAKIADDLNQIGTTLNLHSNIDDSIISINTLTKTMDPAFDIFSDIALHPTFAPKEIERIRDHRLTALAQDKDNPREVASRVISHELYGPNSPYGYEGKGTIESTKKISRDDMVNFWQSGYGPTDAALVIAGDVTTDQARAMAKKYFGDWKSSAVAHKPPEVKNTVKRVVYIVNKEGSPQTTVRIAGIGMSRSNPDYVPAEVMSNGFGGMFSSRLNMNLREKHGYTYGAFSGFSFRRGDGPFTAGGGIRTNVTGPAVSEIFKEVEEMRTNPLSPQELKMAKDNLQLSLAGLFETSGHVANTLSGLFVYDLPLDYYSTLPAKINAVSQADVASMVSKYLKPENMVVVTVGDKKKIEPELKKLNLGPIEELDFEANPVK